MTDHMRTRIVGYVTQTTVAVPVGVKEAGSAWAGQCTALTKRGARCRNEFYYQMAWVCDVHLDCDGFGWGVEGVTCGDAAHTAETHDVTIERILWL